MKIETIILQCIFVDDLIIYWPFLQGFKNENSWIYTNTKM